MNLQKIKDDLEKLILKSGKIVKKGYKEKDKSLTLKKDANDYLTRYDTMVNSLILKHLEKNYPQISVISEEAPEIIKDSDYAFVVDPIDGTRNFVRGVPIFFIGIALVKNNKTILSITHNPVTDDLFWAIRGKGAYLNNKKIKVSKNKLESSDVTIRVSQNKTLNRKIVTKAIENVYQVKNNVCSHDEISGIACNRYDGLISKGSSPWDYCHYLLAEEAGGIVTDWVGDEFDISKDDIIISNGVIHDELLKIVK